MFKCKNVGCHNRVAQRGDECTECQVESLSGGLR